MSEYLVLVFIHIVGGVFWAGGSILTGFFIIPAVVEAGPAGGAVFAGVMKRKLPLRITASAVVTTLAGLRLYSIRFTPAWALSPEGLVLGLGGLIGLSALFIALARQKPAADKLGRLGEAIAIAGGMPTPDQTAEMERLRRQLQKSAKVQAWHLVAVLVLMAVHRLAAAY